MTRPAPTLRLSWPRRRPSWRPTPDGTILTPADLGWAARSGAAYARDALTGNNLVLIARDGHVVAGHLVGRLSERTGVHPIRLAELESIHVYQAYRGGGGGTRLIEAFLGWAAKHGAVRASVTAYAANEAALRFYARHGFAVRSIIADRPHRPDQLNDSTKACTTVRICRDPLGPASARI